ncbi:MAG: hypothetical protein HKN03_07420 [Acidimicrobiales bacterium]|nr:hypothetical protein [Acidimicrobiales bacterium]
MPLEICPHGVIHRDGGVGERLGVGENELLDFGQAIAVFPIGDGVDRGVIEPQLTAEGECQIVSPHAPDPCRRPKLGHGFQPIIYRPAHPYPPLHRHLAEERRFVSQGDSIRAGQRRPPPQHSD